jgi:hypothetical protein
MTVKELKDHLSHFNDNMIVMIPKRDSAKDSSLPYRTITYISSGVNELDSCIFLEDIVCCDTCINELYDPEEEPCCSCTNCTHWEPKEDLAEE